VSAAYMLRQGRHKYIHYTGHAPELFDLEADPEELDDLAGRPDMQSLLGHFERLLHTVCDPQATDARAKQDQAALIRQHGGAPAILARGGSSYTPIPGEEVRLMSA
jgi:choline-sulfatase